MRGQTRETSLSNACSQETLISFPALSKVLNSLLALEHDFVSYLNLLKEFHT